MKIDQVEDGSAAVVLSLQCKSYVDQVRYTQNRPGSQKVIKSGELLFPTMIDGSEN